MLTWPSPRAFVIAFSGYLAVMIALYVAFSLELPNPWWAMATVYIVQPPKPLTGAIWAKALYRIAGTVIGAAASVVIVPNLVDSPELLILAVASWIGICTFGGLLDRSPRSYLFILAGYTVAVVGLPAATHPDTIFDLAVARAEEIILGVLAPAVVQSLLFPRSVAAEMSAKLDGVMADTRTWIAVGLRDLAPGPTPHHLASQLTEINLMATDWRFEGTFSKFRRRALWALEERLIALFPLITAVEDRLVAVSQAAHTSPQLVGLAPRVADWVAAANEADPDASRRIADEIRAIAPALTPTSTWPDMLVASLTGRMTELVTTWNECVLLAAVVETSAPRLRALAAPLIGDARPRALHVDRGIALLSAVVAALTVIGLAVFGIAIQWEGVPFAIPIAAVCCTQFATADDPTPLAWDFFIGFLVALPLPLVYLFVILPAIDGFVMLAVVLFPMMMTLGLLLTHPRYLIRALGAIVAVSAGLALQPNFASDLPGFLNLYLALGLGPIFALIGLGLGRVLTTHCVIRRLLRAGWRDLAAFARAQSVPNRVVCTSRLLDRVGLLLPRLSRVEPGEEIELSEALRDLRLGVGMVELRRLRAALGVRTRGDIDFVLAELAKHFDELSRGRSAAVPMSIVDHLDAIVAEILKLADPEDRYAGVGAALGFRRSLFPTAPAYMGPTP